MFPCRYPSDDINKFLWMVRIGGGVFPDIKEKDYLANGQYRIDGEVTKVSTGIFISLQNWLSFSRKSSKSRKTSLISASRWAQLHEMQEMRDSRACPDHAQRES